MTVFVHHLLCVFISLPECTSHKPSFFPAVRNVFFVSVIIYLNVCMIEFDEGINILPQLLSDDRIDTSLKGGMYYETS